MYRIGIDLGGTNIKVGLVNESQEIVVQKSVPTRRERPYQEIISDMAVLIKEIIEEINAEKNEKEKNEILAGIGIGCPGTIDTQRGIVVYSNNIAWENVPFVAEIQKYFDCPVAISNDANCAALGEAKAGAAKGVQNVILLTLGTGVGGGIIIDGKIFEGAHAGGAELGHTTLILGGEDCTCGRKGCVEAYVSASALIRDAKRAVKKDPVSVMNQYCRGNVENMNGKIPFDAAWSGDEAAKKVVDRYMMYLGEAITNYVNIFRPDVVLLSGGICNQGKKLTDPLNDYIKKTCFGGERSFVPEVRCATLGNSAGIIGAANLV